MNNQFRPYNPPRPKPREIPVTEKLVTPHDVTHEHILVAHKAIPHRAREPRYNKLYGSNGVEGAWRYIIDFQVNGSTFLSSSAQTNIPIKLTSAPNWKLQQWPGAVQLFLCIRMVSIAGETFPATITNFGLFFTDAVGGNTIPLGEINTTNGTTSFFDLLIPTPITDPSNLNLGTLYTSVAGNIGTTYDWQMAFSGAYLLPELNPYDNQIVEEEHHHHGLHTV